MASLHSHLALNTKGVWLDVSAGTRCAMDIPSEKSTRYDRQLRLWGDHGQTLLESSHVCLINATATGTEILKNIILPGIGAFTILDGGVVNVSDLGGNFFVTGDDIGKSRSRVTVNFLQELNMEVKGNFIDEDFETVLCTDSNFFSQFEVVIASDLRESSLLKLSLMLWKSCTPLIVARSYGLVGHIRIAVPVHEVSESHPDNFHDDLRLDLPFQEVMKYMDEIDLSKMDSSQRGNVPYLVILYKCLQKWKSIHNKFPCDYKEKSLLKKLIKHEMGNLESPTEEADNVEEAIKNVNHKVVETRLPSDVKYIFEDQMCTNLTHDSNTFWILARAVKEFVYSEGNGYLPLRGSIPDMTSSSDMYVKLQRAYQSHANNDVDAVMSHVQHILSDIGRMKNAIPKKNVKDFCKNSAFLRVIKYRSISDEYTDLAFEPLRALLDDPNNDSVYYILLRAAEKFYSLYQCFPGEKQDGFESDVAQMKSFVLDFFFVNGLSSCTVSDDHITEFCRYGGKEIHSVAAFIGGVASQEIIKLISHQFIPLDNTLIYHAGSSTTITLTL